MKVEISKIPCGGVFNAFGDAFVVLDHIDGGVFCITKDIWEHLPFDKNGSNDFRSANISAELELYYQKLRDNGATPGFCQMMRTDLKATDGIQDYGIDSQLVGMLTLEQYGKYKHIIPLADEWYWLATPLQCISDAHLQCILVAPRKVWGICTDGSYTYDICFNSHAVRPTINFNASLQVDWQNDAGSEDDKADEELKEQIWSEYRSYLHDWEGTYGDSPLPFDEWQKDYEFE